VSAKLENYTLVARLPREYHKGIRYPSRHLDNPSENQYTVHLTIYSQNTPYVSGYAKMSASYRASVRGRRQPCTTFIIANRYIRVIEIPNEVRVTASRVYGSKSSPEKPSNCSICNNFQLSTAISVWNTIWKYIWKIFRTIGSE
jgi:hypothetical protein